jgi:hypothetical protein
MQLCDIAVWECDTVANEHGDLQRKLKDKAVALIMKQME